MFIPVGQENNEVRRHPWVSYGIILLNILVAIPVFDRDAAETVELDRRAEAADEYLSKHPYLSIPAGLTRFYSPADLERWERIRHQREAEGGLPPAGIREDEHSAGAAGTVTKRESDGRYAFVDAHADLEVDVDPPPVGDELAALLANAERDCFVSASLTAATTFSWRVNGEEAST